MNKHFGNYFESMREAALETIAGNTIPVGSIWSFYKGIFLFTENCYILNYISLMV